MRVRWEDLWTKKTWTRVSQLWFVGDFRSKEKRVWFSRDPVPEEDKLPLAINLVLGTIILMVVFVIAIDIFPLPGKIALFIVGLILGRLPAILETRLKK